MRRLTIADICRTAEKENLKCLSTEYVNNRTDLWWQCKICRHIWPANANNIRGGKGCPKCAGNLPLTLDDAKAIAAFHGGKCHSTVFTNTKTPMDWECAKGYTWSVALGNIRNSGTWCYKYSKKEAADNLRGNLAEIQKICIDRGGECLSTEYFTSQIKLEIRCGNNHPFKKTPNKLKLGEWCPKCSGHIGEEICRFALEQIFNVKFPKSRPVWLKVKGNQCELDGYSESLGIAFEHHGNYHYKIDGFYSKTTQAVKKRKSKDRMKQRLCNQHGIKVIEIPEVPQLTKLKDLATVIKAACKKKKIALPVDPCLLTFNFDEAYQSAASKEKLMLVCCKAESHGGKCLSKMYLGSEVNHLFICRKGHEFSSMPQNILRGHWCPECAGNVPHGIEKMKFFAALHDGECLSTEYENSKIELLWQCKNGTPFWNTPDRIMQRKWWCLCPLCRSNPIAVVKLHIKKCRKAGA